MEVQRLKEIAESLGFSSIIGNIDLLSTKDNVADCPLVLPLVGEFSSGKTTLINALTDSKQLETATKPTTATIYEVHFGADKCFANVVSIDGSRKKVDNIGDLKNAELANAKVVEVFDTSATVPQSVVLVDTPGLSSPDPQHKQTLVDFLPQADGILLVSDINQQITRSLTDFIKTMELSQRKIYLILTKCDTKSETELPKVKQYIAENIKLPMDQIVCVSAAKGNLGELSALFSSIQKDKSEILQNVNKQRKNAIVRSLLDKINELLSATISDDNLDKAIAEQEYKLNKLKRNIERLLSDMQSEIEDINRDTTRRFEDTVFDRLESLVSGSSQNFDSEALSIVNNTASLLVNDFKDKIHDLLNKKARERKNSENEVSLNSLDSCDLSEIKVTGLSYNLNLNTMGHEYDGLIETGVIVVGTAAAAYAGASIAGAAGALDAADTLTDITCDGDKVISNVASKATNQQSKGIISSIVGFVTDRTMGKPQRRRAIHNYLDDSLIPSFKAELNRNKDLVIGTIDSTLNAEAQSMIGDMKNTLKKLQEDKNSAKQEFENRQRELASYKNELENK